MSYQTGSNVLVALHRETAIGVQATATGADQLRIVGSPGLVLNRAAIESQEKRSDAIANMGRLGYKSVEGSYNVELSVGGATDLLLEALMRSTWATSTALTAGTYTSFTVGTNEVVAATGDFTASVLKVGDIFTLSGYSTASSNDLNVQITAITSLTLSVAAGTFATAGAADTTCTLTVLKKLKSATAPTRYSHTVEQYDTDIDLSELFTGCRVVGARFSFKPGEMATGEFRFMGVDRTALATGTSPYFTSPTLSTTLALVADDSSILKDGVAVATYTGFDLEFAITARGEPVIGSLTTPDIFDNDLRVTGTITGLRSDFANLTLYDAETEFELAVKLQEPTGTPPECLAFFLPRVKISGLSADVGGGDGAKIETLNLMVGPKAAATGYDATIATFSSSGAY
jgi:hypothetical protein